MKIGRWKHSLPLFILSTYLWYNNIKIILYWFFLVVCICSYSTPICEVNSENLGQFGIYNLTIEDNGCSFHTHQSPVNRNLCEYEMRTNQFLVFIFNTMIELYSISIHIECRWLLIAFINNIVSISNYNVY